MDVSILQISHTPSTHGFWDINITAEKSGMTPSAQAAAAMGRNGYSIVLHYHKQ